jgi:4'-phosphopantetheinyl transferase
MPEARATTVDVWRARLKLGPHQLAHISRCLDKEEQGRAVRLHFQRDRGRFLASRGILRHILARYLDTAPERIHLGYAPEGKPFLLEHRDLHFNISHAADVLVVGVARDRPLGVDVERVPWDDVVESVSRVAFSAPERRALQSQAAAERREFFTRLWTRKEAYLKADGQGMSLRLDHIDVSTSPYRVLLLDNSCDQWSESPQWTLRSFSVAPGYAASLAVAGHDWRLACRDWPSMREIGPGRHRPTARSPTLL